MTERILAFEPSYLPRLGGGEKFGHRWNAGLAAGGAEVRVLTAVPPLRGSQRLDGVLVDYLDAWRFVGFPWFSAGDVRRAVRSFAPTVAILYGPSPYDAIAAPLLRALGVPFACVYLADFDRRRPHTRAATATHNAIALRLAAGIVCIADATADALARRGFVRPVVIEPGVDERFFEAEISDGADLLFVGALDAGHRYKRIDLLFAALALRPALRARVVGDGDTRVEAERCARDLGVAERVTFLGALDDDALARAYREASALVLPSPTAQEGFGLVCLEAMASGVPVVCSVNAGAAPAVARAPGCALWDGTDVEDLARAIDRASGASRAGREALRAHARRYDWSASANAMRDALTRLPR